MPSVTVSPLTTPTSAAPAVFKRRHHVGIVNLVGRRDPRNRQRRWRDVRRGGGLRQRVVAPPAPRRGSARTPTRRCFGPRPWRRTCPTPPLVPSVTVSPESTPTRLAVARPCSARRGVAVIRLVGRGDSRRRDGTRRDHLSRRADAPGEAGAGRIGGVDGVPGGDIEESSRRSKRSRSRSCPCCRRRCPAPGQCWSWCRRNRRCRWWARVPLWAVTLAVKVTGVPYATGVCDVLTVVVVAVDVETSNTVPSLLEPPLVGRAEEVAAAVLDQVPARGRPRWCR